jgi:hypothetical protein
MQLKPNRSSGEEQERLRKAVLIEAAPALAALIACLLFAWWAVVAHEHWTPQLFIPAAVCGLLQFAVGFGWQRLGRTNIAWLARVAQVFIVCLLFWAIVEFLKADLCWECSDHDTGTEVFYIHLLAGIIITAAPLISSGLLFAIGGDDARTASGS